MKFQNNVVNNWTSKYNKLSKIDHISNGDDYQEVT